MFKTILKHFIYEQCVELMFDTIMKNFPSEILRFHVGQTFDVIEFEVNDIWWGIELAEIIYCDNKLVVVSFASGEVHIPDDHKDVPEFRDSSMWEEVGRYGSEIGEANTMYANYFGGSQVFAIELMKDIDHE